MNFYGAETTEQHSLNGRIIPIMEALWLSMKRASGQPPQEPKYSKVLPAWALKLCDKQMTTIFKNYVKAAPRDNQIVARHYGQIIGFLLRGVLFYFNEMRPQVEKEGLSDLIREQQNKMEEISGLPMLFSLASVFVQKPVSGGAELIEAGTENAEGKAKDQMARHVLTLLYLLERPVEEQYEFLQGIPEGFKAVLNLRGEFTGDKRRLEVYYALFHFWPEIAEMQKAQRGENRKSLLDWLEKQVGAPLVEDPKQFFALCDEIDLDIAPPGHPSNSAPAQIPIAVLCQSVVGSKLN
jgi:hypothetical protein